MSQESSEYRDRVFELLNGAREERDQRILDAARVSYAQESNALDNLPDTGPDLPAILSHEAFELTKRMRFLSRYPHLPHWLGGRAVEMSKMATRSFEGLYAYPQYPVPAFIGSFNALVTPLLCATEPVAADEAIVRDGYVFANPPHPGYKGWLIIDHRIVDDEGNGKVTHIKSYQVVSNRRRWGGGVREIDFDDYHFDPNNSLSSEWISRWNQPDETMEKLIAAVMQARVELE